MFWSPVTIAQQQRAARRHGRVPREEPPREREPRVPAHAGHNIDLLGGVVHGWRSRSGYGEGQPGGARRLGGVADTREGRLVEGHAWRSGPRASRQNRTALGAPRGNSRPLRHESSLPLIVYGGEMAITLLSLSLSLAIATAEYKENSNVRAFVDQKIYKYVLNDFTSIF